MEEKRIKLAKWLLITGMLGMFIMVGLQRIIAAGYISSESMEPTLCVGARIVGYRLDHNYSRGDIIMFAAPDGMKKRYVKRIIGMPGDVISLTRDAVYVNGKRMEEPYLKEAMDNDVMGECRIPAGRYFVMGDNRNNSNDSRHWNSSCILENDIICKVEYALLGNSLCRRVD